MGAYYNENDPYCAQWLRNLITVGQIAPGEVDERSIADIQASDLRGFAQCHFFAGIGIWSYALRLAGWADDRPIWTGSCPCQPFSSASRGRTLGVDDERHLWPVWHELIAECSPDTVLGEQVVAARVWFDGVCDDMEKLGYSIGACVLPACCFGADHVRARLYFACHTDRDRKSVFSINEETPRVPRIARITQPVEDEDGHPGRMELLRAYGNALYAPQAAAFIQAYIDSSISNGAGSDGSSSPGSR
jgi:DNA (cytosine-5)-methyltransferase 1